MNTIEGHFHGETGVDILLEEDAYSVCARPVPGRRKSLKSASCTWVDTVFYVIVGDVIIIV